VTGMANDCEGATRAASASSETISVMGIPPFVLVVSGLDVPSFGGSVTASIEAVSRFPGGGRPTRGV
jgi:hypothetical protein